jgi:nucleoside phosphorylase
MYDQPAYTTPRRFLDIVRALNVADEFGELDVLIKDFASGSVFIDDVNSQLRQDLINKFPQAVIVTEMEAHAVLHAFWELGPEQKNLLVGIIKGISDSSSGDGNIDEVAHQQKATQNATKVAIAIIKALPQLIS